MNDLTIKAIEAYNGNLHNGMTKALEAVVAMVLEEAARVADAAEKQANDDARYWDVDAGLRCQDIAAAIRALKEPKP